MKVVVPGFVSGALFVAALGIGSAGAQIPDEFKNLKVLPKDISKRELIDTMRGFTAALGVRCLNCHVPGPNPNSLEGVDFASDEPKDKVTARAMMRMVAAINHDFIAKTGIESPTEVRCITCHRGVKEPQTLDRLLLGVADTAGVPAAEKRYRELREEYYGSGSYDFGAGTLEDMAQSLGAKPDGLEGAIAMAKLNLEFYPEDARTHALLGQLYATAGNTEDAVRSLERALELEPDNQHFQQMLDKIRSGK